MFQLILRGVEEMPGQKFSSVWVGILLYSTQNDLGQTLSLQVGIHFLCSLLRQKLRKYQTSEVYFTGSSEQVKVSFTQLHEPFRVLLQF